MASNVVKIEGNSARARLECAFVGVDLGWYGKPRGRKKGTGQIRRKVKGDEIRIGIAGARSLSSKAGEGAG
jgi:hypothetical protein